MIKDWNESTYNERRMPRHMNECFEYLRIYCTGITVDGREGGGETNRFVDRDREKEREKETHLIHESQSAVRTRTRLSA